MRLFFISISQFLCNYRTRVLDYPSHVVAQVYDVVSNLGKHHDHTLYNDEVAKHRRIFYHTRNN